MLTSAAARVARGIEPREQSSFSNQITVFVIDLTRDIRLRLDNELHASVHFESDLIGFPGCNGPGNSLGTTRISFRQDDDRNRPRCFRTSGVLLRPTSDRHRQVAQQAWH